MATTDRNFEVAVVGGGPGGYVAAIRAAQLGFRTCVIEKRTHLGGTCLNVGCIPSKALLASSELYHLAKERFAQHGIKFSGLEIDLGVMMKRKDEVVATLAKGLEGLMKKNKITRIAGFAKLEGPHALAVSAEGEDPYRVEAENIILATGSTPIGLPFLPFDGKRVIHSDHGIALKEVPKKLLVIGGGAIGLELASVWSRLGSEVTVIEFLPRIAAFFDEDITRLAQRTFEAEGMKIFCGTKVESAEVAAKGVKLRARQGEQEMTFEGDIVLVAVGRAPNTEGLGAEEAGVELTDRGRIKIDRHWRTKVPSIFAIGDVVDGPMLAHKAEEEGVAVAEMLAGKGGHVSADIVPNVVYTSPEMASVGLNAEQARQRGIELKTGKAYFQANGRALAAGQNEGMVKVMACAKTDRVTGVQIFGHQASELIAEAVLLMEFGGSAEDLGRTIHAHPTMAEALKEAALAVDKRAIHG